MENIVVKLYEYKFRYLALVVHTDAGDIMYICIFCVNA